jgi:hypothetical protein
MTRPAVISISSQQFATDLAVLEGTVPGINWIKVNDLDLINAQRAWMPRHMQEQIFYSYETGPGVEEIWDRARRIGVEIISKAMKEQPVWAVFAGNFDYWQDEAMRLGCEALGIPFLTLLREHYLTVDELELGGGYRDYHLVPKTAGVAVAGETCRQILTNFNIIPDANIRVTGFPRFDLWRRPPKQHFERPVVLLSYLKGYGATEHFKEMLALIAAAAERYEHVPFVVKAKHAFEYPEIEAMLRKLSDKVKLVHTNDMPSLLSGARAIIGYNSLSVYEGLFTQAPIFVPQWGEAKRLPRFQCPSPIDPLLKDHMAFPESAEEFLSSLDAAIGGRYPVSDPAVREAAFGNYFYHTPDELACHRVVKFLREFAKR